MARIYQKHPTWTWEYRGVMPTPFAVMGKERPLVAMFKHVARDHNDQIVPNLQCVYPNEIAMNMDDFNDMFADPVGHYKRAMNYGVAVRAAEDLQHAIGRASLLAEAVKVFENATDEELAAMHRHEPSLTLVVENRPVVRAEAAAVPELKRA